MFRGKAACPPKGQEEECLSCTTVPGCILCSTATREEWRKVSQVDSSRGPLIISDCHRPGLAVYRTNLMNIFREREGAGGVTLDAIVKQL